MKKRLYMLFISLFILNISLLSYADKIDGADGVEVEEITENDDKNITSNTFMLSDAQKYANNEFINYLSEPLIKVPEIEFINFEKIVGDESEEHILSKINVLDIYNLLEDVKVLEKPVKEENTLLTTQEVVEKQTITVNTFDILNYSDTDGPCELVDAVGDVNIVKYYQMTDNISGEVIPLSYYAVCDTVSLIKIIDEQKYNNFKLVDWFTSIDDWTPSDKELNTVYKYNEIKNMYNNGTLAGTGEMELNLENLSDKTLHILYNYEPVKSVFNIVKLDTDYNIIDSITLNKRPDGGVYNSDLLGYSLNYYILSANDKVSNINESVIDSLGEKREVVDNNLNINLSLSLDAKTLYLVYDKIEKNTLMLYGNELAYPYSLSDLVGKSNLLSVYDYVPSAYEGKAYIPECFGHICEEEGCEVVHKCFSHDYGSKRLSVLNNTWTVSVDDTYNYNALTNNIKDYKVKNKLSVTGITDFYGGNGDDYQIIPDAEFVFYRQPDIDKITLYPNKNNNVEVYNALLSIGLDVERDSSYRPLKSRAAQDTFTEESFYNTLSTHWTDGESRDTSLSWIWKIWCDYASEESTGDYNTHYEIGHSPDDLNSYYSYTNNLQTNYYIGKFSQSNEQIEDVREIGGEDLGYIWSFAGSNLSFYPYFRMIYKDLNNKELDVYVTSENESSIRLFNSEQINKISINKNMFKDSLGLDCLFLNELYKRVEGEIIEVEDLETEPVDLVKDGEVVGEFIESESLVEDNGEIVSESLEEEIVDTEKVTNLENKNYFKLLNNLYFNLDINIEYYEDINSKIKDNYCLSNILESSHLYDSQIKIILYRPCIEDDKIDALTSYSFKKTESEVLEELSVNKENYDTLYLNQERNNSINNLTQYNIISDIYGYFIIMKDGNEICKANNLDDLLSNKIVKLLDDNTKIITNLWNVLEHGENTSDRKGEPWYYEAFDGITVYVSELNYYN